MSISTALADKAQSMIPIDLQIRGAHVYDKARRIVTRTDGKKIFTETPIPPVEEVELTDIDLSNPFLYRQGRWRSYFERVRNEAPVHFQPRSPFGPFWSVTRHADIIAVDKNHDAFSAEPFIIIGRPPRFMDIAMFIAMDPPRHDKQRAAVQGVVAPKNLREMEGLIRSRVREVLDELPLDEPFDWVQTVSVELTARMRA
ncbi:cytochrome P450, partial [Tsukamurella sputi]